MSFSPQTTHVGDVMLGRSVAMLCLIALLAIASILMSLLRLFTSA